MQYCPNKDLFDFVNKYVAYQNMAGNLETEGQGLLIRD